MGFVDLENDLLGVTLISGQLALSLPPLTFPSPGTRQLVRLHRSPQRRLPRRQRNRAANLGPFYIKPPRRPHCADRWNARGAARACRLGEGGLDRGREARRH